MENSRVNPTSAYLGLLWMDPPEWKTCLLKLLSTVQAALFALPRGKHKLCTTAIPPQRQSCSPGCEKTHRRKMAPSVTPGTQSFLYPPPLSQVGRSCSRPSGPHPSCSSLYVSIFFIPTLSHTRPPQAPLLPSCSESGNCQVTLQSLTSCQPSVLPAFMLRRSVSFSSALEVLGGSYRGIRALGLPELRYLN